MLCNSLTPRLGVENQQQIFEIFFNHRDTEKQRGTEQKMPRKLRGITYYLLFITFF